jgi:hypothetical protein
MQDYVKVIFLLAAFHNYVSGPVKYAIQIIIFAPTVFILPGQPEMAPLYS